jgi:hypothetical protein
MILGIAIKSVVSSIIFNIISFAQIKNFTDQINISVHYVLYLSILRFAIKNVAMKTTFYPISFV